MRLALSTRWNASRHTAGEEIVDEILDLGFRRLELGYDLTVDLAAGIKRRIDEKAVTVDSVHSYCPVPLGVPSGHPELFPLSGSDDRMRRQAVLQMSRSIEFAAQVGARCVVAHAGRVEMRNLTRKLIDFQERGKQATPRYQNVLLKLLARREKKAPKQLDALSRSLDELLPALRENAVCLALENLPSWEAIPCETEMEIIARRFDGGEIRYWHDTGHGQVRENLGFISHRYWIEKLTPVMAGMHLHDVVPPAQDHAMPPAGMVDFASLLKGVPDTVLLVVEPSPVIPAEEVRAGRLCLRDALGESDSD